LVKNESSAESPTYQTSKIIRLFCKYLSFLIGLSAGHFRSKSIHNYAATIAFNALAYVKKILPLPLEKIELTTTFFLLERIAGPASYDFPFRGILIIKGMRKFQVRSYQISGIFTIAASVNHAFIQIIQNKDWATTAHSGQALPFKAFFVFILFYEFKNARTRDIGSSQYLMKLVLSVTISGL